MEFKGRVTAVLPIERGSGRNGPWARATVVLGYESGQYPKSIALQNSKDAEKFAQIRVGQTGTFQVDFKTREYNGKFYTDINCWSWKLDQAGYDPI
jgi:hypothetical protein